MMSLPLRGLDDICRLCAIESESGVYIYSPEGEHACLENKIISCLRIEVSRNDLLPKKVCVTCNALLEELHQFACRAASAQQTLTFLFDLQLRQLQEQDFNLLPGVKLEGNLIKNELDDLAAHQSDLQITHIDNLPPPCETINYAHLDVLSTPPHDPSLRSQPILLPRTFAKQKIDDIYSAMPVAELKEKEQTNLTEDEPKQIHRRKMLQPKRNAERTDRLEIPVDLELGKAVALAEQENALTISDNSADIECLMDSNCRDNFKDLSESDLREALNEDEPPDSSVDERRVAFNSNNTTKDWAIACATCRDVFALRADFEAHCRDVHAQKPSYTCSQCGKNFDSFVSYRSHYYRHQSKYSCLYCDKVFTLEGMLKVHVLSRHVTVRPFTCDVCGKGYVTQNRLDIHRKSHQSDQKEFRCTQCNKVLQTRNGLNAHMTVHRFGRRFQCHLCGKTFTQKVNMQQHVKYHKGEKPFACDVCNKRFAEKSQLKRHKSHHSLERPFQCPVCLKMYKTERCLKVHSQVHEDRRPFVCTECDKGFINLTKLKQHYHIHTGERPFACKYCERSFTNYPNWLKHTRRRHKVDHKTGVKLKEEDVSGNPPPIPEILPSSDTLENIDFLSMADVKVKDDGLLETQSILTQFHVSADLSPFQLPYIDQSQMLPLANKTSFIPPSKPNSIDKIRSSQLGRESHVLNSLTDGLPCQV